MTNVRLQFHAAPAELVSLGLAWAQAHKLVPVAEQFFPTYAAQLWASPSTLENGQVDRLALCSRLPDVSASTAHEFVSRNQNCLFVSIGGLADDGLRESALNGTTDAPETLRKWRAIVRSARIAMHVGATARNPVTGATAPMPSHRHTPGAHDLAVQGTRMLAVGGWNDYAFSDVALAPTTRPSRDIRAH